MPSNFPGSADSFPDAATIHAKKQDGTADPSPPTATYHSDLLGGLGDAVEAIENTWFAGLGKYDATGYHDHPTFFDAASSVWSDGFWWQVSPHENSGRTGRLYIGHGEHAYTEMDVHEQPQGDTTLRVGGAASYAEDDFGHWYTVGNDAQASDDGSQGSASIDIGASSGAFIALSVSNETMQIAARPVIGQTEPMVLLRDKRTGNYVFTVFPNDWENDIADPFLQVEPLARSAFGIDTVNKFHYHAIGAGGDGFAVHLVNDGPNTAFSVSETSTVVTVHLATNGSGNVTSTVAAVETGINNTSAIVHAYESTDIALGDIAAVQSVVLGGAITPVGDVIGLSVSRGGNVAIDNGDPGTAALTVTSAIGQTEPILELVDENSDDIFTVTIALDNVWRIDGDGAGTPIDADGGGPMQVFVRLDAVDVAFGDDQAALQAAFDAVLGSGVVVISGDWSLFTMTFAVPYFVNVFGGFDLGGNPALPILTELDPGRTNAAEFTGQFTVTANTGLVGEAAVNITKYDGTPGVSHLDDDGGFVFGTITGSESGSLVAKYTGAGVGDPILRATLSDDWVMFNVAAPGSGYATTMTSHEATDVPLTISGWNGQTAALLQILDGDTGNPIVDIVPLGAHGTTQRIRPPGTPALNGGLTGLLLEAYSTEDVDDESLVYLDVAGIRSIMLDAYLDLGSPTSSYATLTVKALPSQILPLLDLRDVNGGTVFSVGPTGEVTNPVGIQTATVHLDASQIALLASEPTEIVAAPGAGKAVAVVAMWGEFQTDAGVYDANLAGLYWDSGALVSNRNVQLGLSYLLGGNGNDLAPQWSPGMPGNPRFDISDIENIALLVAAPNDPTPVSTIATYTITDAGSGYAIGDTGALPDAMYPGLTGIATYVVDAVDGGGAITAATITNGSGGYQQDTDQFTAVITGSGDENLTFHVDTVDAPGGDLYVTVHYYVIDLH